MEVIDGGVTAVPGFQVAAFRAGIKKEGLDMAVLYSERPCRAAAVFTKNRVQGACIHLNRRHLKDGVAQAIVVNSGNANVATGEQGIEDAKIIATTAADELGLVAKNVLVSSTGLIGVRLPVERMRQALFGVKASLAASPEAATQAAEAILTTDTRAKQIAVRIGDVVIGGMAKGAGMIHPNMGTMLVFLTTNADLGPSEIEKMLVGGVERTFNLISIDGDTSTSDSVFLLANGMAGHVNPKAFQGALLHVMQELAKMVVADGEGATKVLKVDVIGAKSRVDAGRAARAVVVSPLVKASFGRIQVPGRILCAIGNSGATFNPFRVDVFYGNVAVVRNGEVTDFDCARVAAHIAQETVEITINLKEGSSHATAYGCDLTAEYVRINAEMYT
jgi:glutamate N-acetyltransferase/amino-acid N-acetyltransferase